jgi:hypothetical protein
MASCRTSPRCGDPLPWPASTGAGTTGFPHRRAVWRSLGRRQGSVRSSSGDRGVPDETDVGHPSPSGHTRSPRPTRRPDCRRCTANAGGASGRQRGGHRHSLRRDRTTCPQALDVHADDAGVGDVPSTNEQAGRSPPAPWKYRRGCSASPTRAKPGVLHLSTLTSELVGRIWLISLVGDQVDGSARFLVVTSMPGGNCSANGGLRWMVASRQAEGAHGGQGEDPNGAKVSIKAGDEALPFASLEAEFQRACDAAIEPCRALTPPPYYPTVWIGKVAAAEAARRLVVSGDVQTGVRSTGRSGTSRKLTPGARRLCTQRSGIHYGEDTMSQNRRPPARRRRRRRRPEAAEVRAITPAHGTTPNSQGDASGQWTPERIAAYVRELVDSFPPLTEEQRSQLALLIRGSLPHRDSVE